MSERPCPKCNRPMSANTVSSKDNRILTTTFLCSKCLTRFTETRENPRWYPITEEEKRKQKEFFQKRNVA